MANGATLIADIERWAGASKEKTEALGRQSITELAYRVQNNSGPPIGPNVITSFFISSWVPSLNAPAPTPASDDDQNDTFTNNMDAQLQVTISTLTIGDIFYYTNNAKYGMRLNYGFTGADKLGRHYHQPGLFFLQKTLAQWPEIVADVAADLRMA